jgi:hypothetical protein
MLMQMPPGKRDCREASMGSSASGGTYPTWHQHDQNGARECIAGEQEDKRARLVLDNCPVEQEIEFAPFLGELHLPRRHAALRAAPAKPFF